MPDFNDAELELVRLEREIGLERGSYGKNAENRELARIDQALQDTSISNLNVLQAPTYSITPTKPRVLINLTLGLVLALTAGCFVGGVADLRHRPAPTTVEDPLIRKSWTIESFEGSMPPGHGESNHANGNGLPHVPR